MFFMNKGEDKGRSRGSAEKLIIFGAERARRGAELKVMTGVEKKAPGQFTRGLREKTSDYDGFDTDRLILKDSGREKGVELRDRQGGAATQKKLERAAGCILQFVGHFAFIAGTRKERRCCREFISWLLQQMRGSVTIPDISRRDDATEVYIPANCKGWVTGNRGSELRRMEQDTGVYMFMALDGRGEERLIIFSADPGSKVSPTGRMAAERLVNEMIQEGEAARRRPPRPLGQPRRRRGAQPLPPALAVAQTPGSIPGADRRLAGRRPEAKEAGGATTRAAAEGGRLGCRSRRPRRDPLQGCVPTAASGLG
ncbi:unnamed protein product, partial [Prorocentrum cordatum]